MPESNLRSKKWSRFLKGPDKTLIDELYVPGLSASVKYDRCCAYFSSSVLTAAARGFGPFIQSLIDQGKKASKPAIRLYVNEELDQKDVLALTESGDHSVLEKHLKKRLKTPKDLLEKRRFEMLGWLAKEGYLDIKVGVMRRGPGIVHAKYGTMTDAFGNAIVFNGSGNESARGLAANYERMEVSTSWDDPERHKEYSEEFELLWADKHSDVQTFSLPEAIKLKLINYAPSDPPVEDFNADIERQKMAMVWDYLSNSKYFENSGATIDETAPVSLWPHQIKVVDDTSKAWPQGRLLCDEVGMGKTIEAIMTIRRLRAGRGVKKVLFLVPAGLVNQWQEELREKGGLIVPILEGSNRLVYPNGEKKKIDGIKSAFNEELLVMSRETARMDTNLQYLMSTEPWDLILLDEAHAAKRKGGEGEFNSGNLLLSMLRHLHHSKQTKGLMLLSATPMQLNPWEPWDLLSVLGDGGYWLAGFKDIRTYYDTIYNIQNGRMVYHDEAKVTSNLICSDHTFPETLGSLEYNSQEELARNLAFLLPDQARTTMQWLLDGSPLVRRMHRNTRNTLREYYKHGIIDEEPPTRNVHDVSYDFKDKSERDLYSGITKYINARFDELEEQKPGKGFVMTIYRRRVASSPYALEQTLKKRKRNLGRVVQSQAYDQYLEVDDIPEYISDDDLPDVDDERGHISSGVPSDKRTAQKEIKEVKVLLDKLDAIRGTDTKLETFRTYIKKTTDDGRAVLVFTDYKDTMHYLRDDLKILFEDTVACYSGDGGEILFENKWKKVTKGEITQLLNEGKIKVLLCTDAASEGLNLQAAGALINYDLPWNPSKVEQRIGRIDRIGQNQKVLPIINFFLKDSVDERVYKVLRERCGLFERFVGPMQPVLAKARLMLLGKEEENVELLKRAVVEADKDLITSQSFKDDLIHIESSQKPVYSKKDVINSLKELNNISKIRVVIKGESFSVHVPGSKKHKYSFSSGDLENDDNAIPFDLQNDFIGRIIGKLQKAGERLPLIVGTANKGNYKISVPFWVVGDKIKPINSIRDLHKYLSGWDGSYPTSDLWVNGIKKAEKKAQRVVNKLSKSERKELIIKQGSRRLAAKIRLVREIGKFLLVWGAQPTVNSLNKTLSDQLGKDSATQRRLASCLNILKVDYPEWSEHTIWELKSWLEIVRESDRTALRTGSSVDAALNDPRWLY